MTIHKSIIIVTILLAGSISIALFPIDKSFTGGGTGFRSGSSFSGTAGVTDSFVSGTLTQGGGVRATTTTATTATLVATDFDVENVIDVTPGGVSLALTLPASSTLSTFIPTAGQSRTVFIRNATTTAGVDVTFIGGVGTILKTASSSPADIFTLTSDTDGDNYARIDFLRKSNTDIDAFLQIYKD